MRSTKGEDGVRRIVAKVSVPLRRNEIAMFALASSRFDNSDTDALNEFEKLNKRQLFNVAKEVIARRGAVVPDETVMNKWTERQIERATKHVDALFPEVD